MRYLGVDAHKRYVTICAVDEHGKICGLKDLYSHDEIVEFVKSLNDDCKVVEAGRCWELFMIYLKKLEI